MTKPSNNINNGGKLHIMKFNVSTKPLLDGLNLAVVTSNISKFNLKSTLAQVTVREGKLILNFEATSVKTQLSILGGVENEDSDCVAFVSCVDFKQLVSTFQNSVTTLEFTDNCSLTLYNGGSSFKLAGLLSSDERLATPDVEAFNRSNKMPVSKTGWKFIDDHQTYAMAMSFVNAVFTRAWISNTGDVLIGDMDMGIFTHSNKGELDQTCLVSPETINLFVSLPDNSTMANIGSSYVICAENDAYTYWAEITPDHEDNPKYGSYNSDIIMGMMTQDSQMAVKVKASDISRAINQADLLRRDNKVTSIKVGVGGSKMTLADANINAVIDVEGNPSIQYEVNMNCTTLRSAINNMDNEVIFVAPVFNEESETNVGMMIWTDEMAVLVSGADE